MAEAILRLPPGCVYESPASAVSGGACHQLADGRAGVAAGDIAAGVKGTFHDEGDYEVAKAASVVMLPGQPLYWDHSANAATYRRTNDRDFFIGICGADAAAADTTVRVRLNVQPAYDIEIGRDDFSVENTDGLGVADLVGTPGVKLTFDAVAEVAQAAYQSDDTVDIAGNPILEAWVAVYDIGDHAALDMDFGLATGSHATDFESVAEFAAIHFDGSDLSVDTHSDDGTTDTAPADSTIDVVDDTPFLVQIDCRDLSAVQPYINGVAAGSALNIAAATGEVKIVAMIEKTSDNTTADFRVLRGGVRCSEG